MLNYSCIRGSPDKDGSQKGPTLKGFHITEYKLNSRLNVDTVLHMNVLVHNLQFTIFFHC